MDRGAWQATVHGVTKNRTWPKRLSMHTLMLLNDLYMFSDLRQGFPFSFHSLIKYLSSSYYMLNMHTSTDPESAGTEIGMPH